MSTSLEQLKASGTVVVADTGDFECMCVFYLFYELNNCQLCDSIAVN